MPLACGEFLVKYGDGDGGRGDDGDGEAQELRGQKSSPER